MKSESEHDGEKLDLLWGIKDIATYLGISEREAFYQAERGNLPVTRVGRRIVASKNRLRAHFDPTTAS